MSKRQTWLLDHVDNVFSQRGEDGVIRTALNILPERDRWCVEFGAWDGLYLSNTANLILNENYSAVLIESDADRFEELKRNFVERSNVIPVHGFVGYDEKSGLDLLLERTPIPRNFDFLSIDVDGNDYHVWAATNRYMPKLVCIEFNPTIPTEVVFIQKRKRDVTHGSSLAALVELGKEKGYELICVLPFNGIFVRRHLFPLFGISDNRPCVLRTDTSAVTHLFSGYDGTVFLSGCRTLPWHGLSLDEARFQALPSWVRKYPLNYSRLQALLFRLLKRVRRFRRAG